MQTILKNTQQKSPEAKGDHLHIRVSEPDKKTLTRAAQIRKLSTSQFLLQLALPVAEEIVKTEAHEMNEVQAVFMLDEAARQEFNRLLDAPPRALPELKKLLSSRPVWESGRV